MRKWLWLIIITAILPVMVLAAQSTTTSTNVVLDVTCEDCDETVIRGCTDHTATNYNPEATEDNGSCVYPVPNVTNFNANLNGAQTRVDLSWDNPSYNLFDIVRIVRGEGSIPTGPNDGVIIYEGGGESAVDTNIQLNKIYYYVAFVRSTGGEHSSGVLEQVSTFPGDDEEEDDCQGNACPPGGGGGGGPIFPEAPDVDPIFKKITLADFHFVQPGEPERTFRNRGTVPIKGDKPLTVWVAYDLFPEVLKSIVVTLHDPDDFSNTYSFLLRVNPEKTRYTATIEPLLKDGIYPVTIHILNFQNQSLREINGRLMVSGLALAEFPFRPLVRNVALPVAVGTGVAVGAAQALAVTAQISSLYDLYLLVLRAFGALLGWLGVRRRQKSWGTVYDAITKRPIDPAYIVVRKDGKEVATAITDIDGRYGFFLPPGTYDIQAGKTHYRFPSQIMAGKSSDILYDNLYFGESIQTEGEDVIAKNIPLDPVEFDWNEFIKGKADFFRTVSKREVVKTRIINAIYAVGFTSTLASVVMTPSRLNICILALYVLLYGVQIWWHFKHKIVTVKRADGVPLPFAVVTVYLPDINQRIKSVVTDQLGRFYMLVPPNVYYVTVEEKQADGSYQLVYRSDPMELKKGVLSSNLIIPGFSS